MTTLIKFTAVQTQTLIAQTKNVYWEGALLGQGLPWAKTTATKAPEKRDNDAPLQNTPADVRTVILVLGGFLLTLFFVTKVALGL